MRRTPGRHAAARLAPSLRPGRGFTILELLVTVTLVGILVAMAVPSVAGVMRDRRTRQAANEAAMLYRQARATAMGRGGAVLVRYSAATRGRIEVREALAFAGGAATLLPSPSCQLTVWSDGDPSNRLLSTFDLTANGAYDNVKLDFRRGTDNSVQNAVDICFSPLGRPFFRLAASGLFNPLTEVPYIQSVPLDGFGRTRTVLIVPSGLSRVAL